ncbi:unnamed protein product, partial [Prorocentrum cordatum]
MDLVVSDPVAFVSDATAVAAVTDSIASLVGVVASRVSVTLNIGSRLEGPSRAVETQRGSSTAPGEPAREDTGTRVVSATNSTVRVSYSITTVGGPDIIDERNSDIVSALTASGAASTIEDLTTANLQSQGASYTLMVESLSAPSIDNITLTVTSTTTTLSMSRTTSISVTETTLSATGTASTATTRTTATSTIPITSTTSVSTITISHTTLSYTTIATSTASATSITSTVASSITTLSMSSTTSTSVTYTTLSAAETTTTATTQPTITTIAASFTSTTSISTITSSSTTRTYTTTTVSTTSTTSSSSTSITRTTSTSTSSTRTTTRTSATTTTTTTMTSSTTTTTTSTTIGVLTLVAIPTKLTSCNSLLVHAGVPDDTTELSWSCEPVTSQLCADVLSVAAAGTVVTTLQLSSDLISDAAAADAGLSSPMSVWLHAHGLNQHGDQSLGSTAFTFDFDRAGSASLSKAISTTEYTLLDDYVRLRTNVMLCDGAAAGGGIEVAWSWRASGGLLWTEWINPAGVAYASLKMPVSELGAAGNYEVKASIVGSEAGDVTFSVTVGDIPPPDVRLALPAEASRGCGFLIDASGSTDPIGSDLSFAWACESDNSSELAASVAATAACSAVVAGATASSIALPSGSLLEGAYRFIVTVSRADAKSTTQGSVLVTSAAQPVVSFSWLAAEVSPQQPLTVSASVAESAGCTAPAWKTWWLLAPSGSSATQLTAPAATSLVELSVPSLSAAFGTYQLRLVLSESEYFGFAEDSSNAGVGGYVFDSAYFLIDEPPAGGSCNVFPGGGSATLTKFTLFSSGWLDDDLPLLHKFSRCSGTASDGCDSWITVSAYSQSGTMQNVLLSTPGTVRIRADVKDALGSSSAAVTEVEVTELAEAVSDDALLDVAVSVASFGDPFATLAALSAVAGSAKNRGQEFSGTLLDMMSDSGALSDPCPESIDATTTALHGVVASASTMLSSGAGDGANSTVQEVVMEVGVAAKAAVLVTNIAVAATGMDEGMDVGTATLLISSVATLLNSATVTPIARIINDTLDKQVANQKALSSQLQLAIEAVGDAVIQAISLGETATLSSSSGLQLNVMKADNGALAEHGATVGSFTLPPMPGLGSGRRLHSGRSLASAEAIGLQNAVWHHNPFSYAGSTAPAPESSTGVVSDLSIVTDGVRSLSIRLDGEEVMIRDLEDPIIIGLPRHSDADRMMLSSQRRLVEQVEECMYFNHTSEIWSTEGCSVVEVRGDTLICACNHLSFFSSALGSLTFLSGFFCPDVAILSPAGFANLGQGQWAQQRGGMVLWMLLTVLLVVALAALWSQGTWRAKPSFCFYSDDYRSYSNMAVLNDMMSAGQMSGTSRPKMIFAFIINAVLRLQLDYDWDELCQKNMFDIIRTLVFHKAMVMWVTATMGFSELDLRYLRYGSVV